MALPRISLDETNPDNLYSGAQKINQAIDSLDSHINDNSMPHKATDPVTGKVYRWGLAVQNGEWGIIYEEVV